MPDNGSLNERRPFSDALFDGFDAPLDPVTDRLPERTPERSKPAGSRSEPPIGCWSYVLAFVIAGSLVMEGYGARIGAALYNAIEAASRPQEARR